MTEQRQKLLDEFNAWFATKPNKRIMAAECANIAEKYAAEQLKLYGVGKQSELLPYSDAEITKQALKIYGTGQKGHTYEQKSAYVKGAIDYRESKIERI